MEIELRLLRSFLVVAEEGHVSRAARRLSITQPALTRQLQRLERHVGSPLLHRGPGGVALTEAGRVLAGEAGRILADGERAVDRARRAARGETGHLAIGFIASAAADPMVPLLGALRERHAGVSVSLTERRWLGALDGLRSGEDDVAFVRDLPAGAPWSTVTLTTEALCLVVHGNHKVARRRALSVADLRAVADEPFVSTREWIETHTAHWPVRPRIGQEVDSAPAAFALVRAGFGHALFSEALEPLAGEDLAFVPIAGQTSSVQLAWGDVAARAAVASFIALARALRSAGSRARTRR